MNTIDNVAARNPHFLWAGGSALLLAAVAALSVPVLDQPWGVRPWFQAMYLCGVILLKGLIALFLALQFLAGSPGKALAWLSSGYVFTAVIAAMIFLTFPGILDQPLVSGAGEEQVAVWLWILWHAGFPAFILLALAAKAPAEGRPRPGVVARSPADLLPVAAGAGLALAGSGWLIAHPDLLPVIVEGDDYSSFSHSLVAGAIVAFNVFALAALIYATRLRESLYLWLAVALFAFALDIALSIGGASRYSAGWYVGHGLSLASAAALMSALLIDHFKLHRDAEVRAAFHEQEALHDPLTGLFNRRYLGDKLAEELGRARRYRYPISVLLLDIDYFKRINDDYGHGVGDACLRALAQALGKRVHRSGDFTVRYGGEEFVVVLPETGVAGAMEVGEEIRQRVEALYGLKAAPCPMTVSVGVATADSASPPPAEQLLAAADDCLYRAKHLGRNRVVGPQTFSVPRHARPAPA